MKLKSLTNITTPEKIPVLDAPLTKGGKVTYISRQEFERLCNFTYSENIWISEDDYQAFREYVKQNRPPMIDEQFVAKLRQRINNPWKNLALYNLQSAGWSIVTTGKVSRGEVLGWYAGVLTFEHGTEDDYHTSFEEPIHLEGNIYRGVTARERGGMARFFAHLPLDQADYFKFFDELAKRPALFQEFFGIRKNQTQSSEIAQQVASLKEQIEVEEQHFDYLNTTFSEKTQDKVAKDGLQICPFYFDNCYLLLLVARRDFSPGELVGFDYGNGHWQCRQRYPLYFNNTTLEPIPLTSYFRTKIRYVFRRDIEQGKDHYSHFTANFLPLLNKPIMAGSEIISCYRARQALADANVENCQNLGKIHSKDYPFALLMLKQVLPYQIEMNVFYDLTIKENSVFNVVFVSSEKDFAFMEKYFQPLKVLAQTPKYKSFVHFEFHRETQEIILYIGKGCSNENFIFDLIKKIEDVIKEKSQNDATKETGLTKSYHQIRKQLLAADKAFNNRVMPLSSEKIPESLSISTLRTALPEGTTIDVFYQAPQRLPLSKERFDVVFTGNNNNTFCAMLRLFGKHVPKMKINLVQNEIICSGEAPQLSKLPQQIRG